MSKAKPPAVVVALCSQKGGVGKTSVTAGLADVLTRRGLRVLAIDADPQANLTDTLGVQDPEFTLNDVLAGGPDGAVTPGSVAQAFTRAGPAWGSLDVVASELALANREQDQQLGREHRLRIVLDGCRPLWDAVLVDCPPALGPLTVSALVAADQALFVTEARATSVDGLVPMTKTVATIQSLYNQHLRIGGIVVNRYRADRPDRTSWADTLRRHYGDTLIEPYLPEREVVAIASSAAAPVSAYGSRAKDYLVGLDAVADRIMSAPAAIRH